MTPIDDAKVDAIVERILAKPYGVRMRIAANIRNMAHLIAQHDRVQCLTLLEMARRIDGRGEA